MNPFMPTGVGNGLVAVPRPPTDAERKAAQADAEKVRRLQVRTNAAQIAGNMLAGHAPTGETFHALAHAVVAFIEA